MKTINGILHSALFSAILLTFPVAQPAAAQDYWGYSSDQPNVQPTYSDTTGTYDSTGEGDYTINNYYYGSYPGEYAGYGWYPWHPHFFVGFGVGFGYASYPWWDYDTYPGWGYSCGWGGYYSPYYYPGYYGYWGPRYYGYGYPGYYGGGYRYGTGYYGYGNGGRTIGTNRGFGYSNGNIVTAPPGTHYGTATGPGASTNSGITPGGRTIGNSRGFNNSGTTNGNIVGTPQQNRQNAMNANQSRPGSGLNVAHPSSAVPQQSNAPANASMNARSGNASSAPQMAPTPANGGARGANATAPQSAVAPNSAPQVQNQGRGRGGRQGQGRGRVWRGGNRATPRQGNQGGGRLQGGTRGNGGGRGQSAPQRSMSAPQFRGGGYNRISYGGGRSFGSGFGGGRSFGGGSNGGARGNMGGGRNR